MCNKAASGTLIADANTINSILISGKRKIFRKDILQISIPLECLFCCPLSQSENNLIDGLKKIFSKHFASIKAAENSGFSEETPDFIEDILISTAENVWQEKYEKRFKGIVRCIAVIDLRDLKKSQANL